VVVGALRELPVCRGFSYLPIGEKYPDFTLYGIFLSLSGDGKFDYPIAARGALRFLGETANEAIRNSIVDLRAAREAEPEELLKNSVGGYMSDLQKRKLLRPDIFEQIEGAILPKINNRGGCGSSCPNCSAITRGAVRGALNSSEAGAENSIDFSGVKSLANQS
jgi:hypothetical protein